MKQISFDAWLGDKERDLIGIKGQGSSLSSKLLFNFDLDHTHFGALQPQEMNLVLGKNGNIEQFLLRATSDLRALYHDCERPNGQMDRKKLSNQGALSPFTSPIIV